MLANEEIVRRVWGREGTAKGSRRLGVGSGEEWGLYNVGGGHARVSISMALREPHTQICSSRREKRGVLFDFEGTGERGLAWLACCGMTWRLWLA